MSVQQLPADPYANRSTIDSFQRWRHLKHPENIRTCVLSKKPIEIPNREFSVQNERGRVDYDIYRLAVHILTARNCEFPGTTADFTRFRDAFGFTYEAFTGLWGEDSRTLLQIDLKRNRLMGVYLPTQKDLRHLHELTYLHTKSQHHSARP